MAERKPWTRKDQVLVLDLYARTPFGKMHSKNPEVIELAQFLGRSPNSVAMKLANYASLDETLDRKGLQGASKADREVWDEFFADPERFLETAKSILEAKGEWPARDEDPEPSEFREGEEALRTVKVRKNQSAFRAMVLSAYNSRCALTGIELPEVLIASHIIPWSKNEKLRLDPRNGICLNSLHDRAFDKGLITLNNDLSVRCSPKLLVPADIRGLFEGRVATAPDKFHPLPEYLEYHRDVVFEAS
ncbi:MAG: HNH endonuclease [Hyphomonas sp.]|nr:HNH endonuclease [Hyphomonas sp.]